MAEGTSYRLDEVMKVRRVTAGTAGLDPFCHKVLGFLFHVGSLRQNTP